MPAAVQALGNLTSYLHKHHKPKYDEPWNRLILEATARAENVCGPGIVDGLRLGNLPVDWVRRVLFDVLRAAVEATYVAKLPRVPRFFTRLNDVYAAGRLPCGWVGAIDEVPRGELIVF